MTKRLSLFICAGVSVVVARRVSVADSVVDARNSLARTPPMGWMSWELFRCDIDCTTDPEDCIGEHMYKSQVDALKAGGFVDAGYTGIHMDDCWEEKSPMRDAKTGRLQPNATRFPSGLKALGDYMHSNGATFGLYTAESPSTCGGYPASANNEALDAKTFAEWGVDYLKVDGCGPQSYYEGGYKAMGEALAASGRDIVYSCSWPAYINGGNEFLQPFGKFINDGCNLWRNYEDIQCNWNSLSGIIDHWGDYGEALVPAAGPGHWHDMDMLLVGAVSSGHVDDGGTSGERCVSLVEEQTQMAIWSISAAPLIMGNDLRHITAASKTILLNRHAIAVNQDPLGQMGRRLSVSKMDSKQLWSRHLANGDVAVALYNKDVANDVKPPFAPTSGCPASNWVGGEGTGGYHEACGKGGKAGGGNIGSFTNFTLPQAQDKCCANAQCAGFSWSADEAHPVVTGTGDFKSNANCGFTKSRVYIGYTRGSAIPTDPPPTATADIKIVFADVNLYGTVHVFDIWSETSLGSFTGSYTAKAVPHHGTAFLRLTGTKTHEMYVSS